MSEEVRPPEGRRPAWVSFPGWKAFLWLAAPVAMLVALDVVDRGLVYFRVSGRRTMLLNVELPNSLLSIYGFGLWLVLVVCLFLAWRRHRAGLFAALALVFALLGLDDMMELHEALGQAVGPSLPQGPGGFSEHMGELLVAAVYGLVLLPGIGIAAWRARPEIRRWGQLFLVLIVLLAAFGVVIDQIHAAIGGWAYSGTPAFYLMGLIEDGGEALVMSLMCAAGLELARSPSLSEAWPDPAGRPAPAG